MFVVGFVMGIECLVLLLIMLIEEGQDLSFVDVYVMVMGEEVQLYVIEVVEYF